MATVNLHLKRPEAKKTAVFAEISDGRKTKRIRVYSGQSVNPKHWSKKTQKVHSADPLSVAKNRILADFKDKILVAYYEAKQSGIAVTAEILKKALFPEQKPQLEFWDVYEMFARYKKSFNAPGAYSKYDTLQKHLKMFEEERKRGLTLKEIDALLLENIQSFYFQKRRWKNRTTNKYFGFLFAFLNWCLEHGHISNTSYKKFKPVKPTETDDIALTRKDIKKIEDADLGDRESLKNVRELLILSCETGLRHSDYSRIGKQHLIKVSDMTLISIRQKKTSDSVRVPLSPKALNIVNRIINEEVHAITNQKMNKYLKELGQIAGLDDLVEVSEQIGTEKTFSTKRKYELLKTHVGRKTFATRLQEKRVPVKTSMKMTGHKDTESFNTYVRPEMEDEYRSVLDALNDEPEMKVTKSIALPTSNG